MGVRMSTESFVNKISVHPLSKNPTKAWETLKSKQTVKTVKAFIPDTPVREDHLRFVCISDTHNQIENTGPDFIPLGDVLLHAGDFSNIGLPKEIKYFNSYVVNLPHKLKVVIAGNHDLTMDMEMVKDRQHLAAFGVTEQKFEHVLEELGIKTTRELLTSCIYLEDTGVDICGIKIFGCPWQPEFGGWGFNLIRGEPCLEKWNQIPSDTDILMTHGPPIGHGDYCSNQLRAGCVELLSTVQNRVRPRYHIFGHIHEGYGITTDGRTTFINASTCSLRYKPTNPPIVFDIPIPEGHTKAELDNIPPCNLENIIPGNL